MQRAIAAMVAGGCEEVALEAEVRRGSLAQCGGLRTADAAHSGLSSPICQLLHPERLQRASCAALYARDAHIAPARCHTATLLPHCAPSCPTPPPAARCATRARCGCTRSWASSGTSACTATTCPARVGAPAAGWQGHFRGPHAVTLLEAKGLLLCMCTNPICAFLHCQDIWNQVIVGCDSPLPSSLRPAPADAYRLKLLLPGGAARRRAELEAAQELEALGLGDEPQQEQQQPGGSLEQQQQVQQVQRQQHAQQQEPAGEAGQREAQEALVHMQQHGRHDHQAAS